MRLICAAALFLALIISPTKVEALFASVKSMGMAGAAVAYPQDSLSIAYNPAGIVFLFDRIDVEAAWLRNRATLEVHGNHLHHSDHNYNAMRTKDFYFANFGFIKTFTCQCFEWTLGFAGYNRYFQKTTYNHRVPFFGYTKPGMEFINETVSPTLAFRLWGVLSLGISFDWQIERVRVKGLEHFAKWKTSINQHHVTNKRYDYAYGFGPTFGYQLLLGEHLTVGFSYSRRVKMSHLKKYRGFFIDGRIDLPERWNFGIAIDILPVWTVCVDAEWIRWGGVRSFSRHFVPPTFNLHTMNIVNKFGSKTGAGFGFPNQWIWRVGLEWRVNPVWAFRIGWRHNMALSRRSQTLLNALTQDCVEDYFTFGTSWNITICNEVSTFFAYGVQKKIKGENSIPKVFGNGEADLKEMKFWLGVAWAWKF